MPNNFFTIFTDIGRLIFDGNRFYELPKFIDWTSSKLYDQNQNQKPGTIPFNNIITTSIENCNLGDKMERIQNAID